jgi:orotidine-5'-phosphate decarboxylase
LQPHFADRLEAAIAARRTPAVVGIDPVLDLLPDALHPKAQTLGAAVSAVEQFCTGVIDAVAAFVPAVKINSGFFEALYAPGVAAYYRLIAYAHRCGLLVIGDIKRGDIGSTAELYARGHLAEPQYEDVDPATLPDAVTLAGYLGKNAVRPFIDAARATGRGAYVLVRPSDPGADEVHEFGGASPFFAHMAGLVDQWGGGEALRGASGLSCLGAVVAPKDAASTAALRQMLPNTPFLVPGYGAQGATAEACRACFLPDGRGAVVNASRSVIYAHATDKYRTVCGGDWRRCVAAAAKDFGLDVARAAGM